RAGVLASLDQARERGGEFRVRLREGIDDRFIATLMQAGLVPAVAEASTPGMVAFPIDHDVIEAMAPPDLEIRLVTDAAGIDAHRSIVTAGFGSGPAGPLGTAGAPLSRRPRAGVLVCVGGR